jgi:uncharacterized RDD family membrane protein YckC
VSEPAPGAASRSPAATEPDPRQRLVAAPLVRRMAAFLYEGVLVFGILFATGLVYGVAVRQTNAMQHRAGLIAVCFLVLGAYFIGLWTRGGQTLAMKTWHLRVVSDSEGRSGALLSPRRALARYLAAWIWFVPPLLFASTFVHPSVPAYLGIPALWVALYALSALFHPRRQFWHDALCDTAVVSSRPVAPLPQ